MTIVDTSCFLKYFQDMHFLALVSGNVAVVGWSVETCGAYARSRHKEYVTAGINTYRIWDIFSGEEASCIKHNTVSLPMTVAFGREDAELLVGYEDRSIVSFDLSNRQQLWAISARSQIADLYGCPQILKFSLDLSKVAMAWRGRPLVIWNIDSQEVEQLSQCKTTDHCHALCVPETVK